MKLLPSPSWVDRAIVAPAQKHCKSTCDNFSDQKSSANPCENFTITHRRPGSTPVRQRGHLVKGGGWGGGQRDGVLHLSGMRSQRRVSDGRR